LRNLQFYASNREEIKMLVVKIQTCRRPSTP
jgi:hypothetical protein